nr:MAG TPA: peptidase [Caudoviricetes sp.]DAU48165.1 MAG TPA: peptidase [Bacteriophage sp.]
MNIKQIQCLLAYLGYDPGDIDGANGENTIAAVKRFQADYGLPADGDAGAATQKMLTGAVAGTAVKVEKPVDTAESGEKTGTFWDDIEYFSRAECRCKCGGRYCNGYPAEMEEETMRLADEIRRRAGVPLNVNSGVRCKQHNAEVGGVWNSLHLTGQAIDLAPIGGNISTTRLQEIAEQVQAEKMPGRGGLGRYDWGVHVDNGKYSRWNG